MLLLCGSFAELGANYRPLSAATVQALAPLFKSFRKVKIDKRDLIYDPAPKHEQVPW